MSIKLIGGKRIFIPGLISLGLSFISLESRSQEVAAADGTRITATLATTQTWTSNISSSSENPKTGIISEFAPGIKISAGNKKLRGFLDYTLHQFFYSNELSTTYQNSLNSLIFAELIDNFAFLDASAVISRQTISAFGSQITTSGIENSNTTEVSSYRLSPFIRGYIKGDINYEARYSLLTTHAKSLSAANSNQQEFSTKLNDNSSSSGVGWGISLDKQISDQSGGQNVEIDSYKGTAYYSLLSSLTVNATVGYESGNYTSPSKQSSTTNGAGFDWSPFNITKFSGNFENRILGKMHRLVFEHRLPRTTWIISDIKEISLSNNISGSGGGGIYDLLYNQFASIEPDPIKRAQLVQSFLQINGINSSPATNYLTSGTSIRRTQELAFILNGIRDNIGFTATRSTNSRPSGFVTSVDDFSQVSSIYQNGFSVSYSHRLTPNASLTGNFSLQKVRDATGLQNANTKDIHINLSSKISKNAFVGLTMRHVVSDSTNVARYKENAISGSLTLQF